MIFAISDAEYSASSYDGSTWGLQVIPLSSQRWDFIGGSTGQFLFSIYDRVYKSVNTVYTMTLSSIHVSTLPSYITNSIIAIADGINYVVTSYNGVDFREVRDRIKYLTLATTAKVRTTIQKRSAFNKAVLVHIIPYFNSIILPRIYRYTAATATVLSNAFQIIKGNRTW